MTRIASFDVFDTVLVRRVVSDEAAFRLLALELGREPEAFVRMRREAELAAWTEARESGGEVRLEDVHAHLEPRSCERTLAAELALERRLITRLPGAVGRTKRQRQRGRRIAYVTDTPLPEAFVRERLAEAGLLEEDDLVLVSSACGVNKEDGAIYRLLAERAGVDPSEILHEGDRAEHDVSRAEAAGLIAHRFDDARPNRYERQLDATGPELARHLAGAARLARLEISVTDAREAALRDVAAGVVAPLLTGYVLWVLAQARRLDLSTLWFLGRDGQVLLRLAETIAPRLGVRIGLRYLHASRQAWNLPGFVDGAHPGLEWIWDRTDDLTPRRLLARLALEPEEVASELRTHGVREEAFDRPLTPGGLRDLRPLAADEGFRDRVRARGVYEAELLARHLREVELLDDPRPGVVELTGHGNLQESLTAVLGQARGPGNGARAAPVGLYLARMDDGRERRMGPALAWHETDGVGSGLLGIGGAAVIALEAFAAADHGTLVGYEDLGVRIRPRLARERNEPVLGWGLGLVWRTLGAFARHLPAGDPTFDPEEDVRTATAGPLRAFWLDPTPEEARAWGEFPWEDGFGTEARHLPLARPLAWRDALVALRRGALPRPHRAIWPAAVDVLTPPLRRSLVHVAARWGRAARRNGRG